MKKNHLSFLVSLLGAGLCLSSCNFTIYGPGSSSANNGGSYGNSVSFDNSSNVASTDSTSGYSSYKTKITDGDVAKSQGIRYFPSTGTNNLLVIPVTIKGFEKNATAAMKTNIEKNFFGAATDTGWESLSSFYSSSSQGKQTINGTVSDWYACGLTPAEIVAKEAGGGEGAGTNYVLEHAVAWYKTTYNDDCTQFDNDKDGIIDGVWLIYSAPDYSVNGYADLTSTFWAFTYWDTDYEVKYTSPTPCAYCWASYDFMFEGYGTSTVDAHTFIHETGHLMGLEDYYDYNSAYAPMGGVDMMDANIIDHNCFSKFSYGWVNPYLVSKAGTITIRPAESSGDCVILPTARSWNGSAFDEYLMLEYYTPTGLNAKDSSSRYSPSSPLGFTSSGIRVYHVDARLCTMTYSKAKQDWIPGSYTDTIQTSNTMVTTLSHTNTPASKNGDTSNRLDENYRLLTVVDAAGRIFSDISANSTATADNNTLFKAGGSFDPTASKFSKQFVNKEKGNNGMKFAYSFSVDAISDDGATITFSAV